MEDTHIIELYFRRDEAALHAACFFRRNLKRNLRFMSLRIKKYNKER